MLQGNEESEAGLGDNEAWNRLDKEPNSQGEIGEQPAEEIGTEEDVNLSGQAGVQDSPETAASEQSAQQPPQIDDWDSASEEDRVAYLQYQLEHDPSEVTQGYLRQQDYTTKTTETAEETKRLEAERADLDRVLMDAQQRQQTAQQPEDFAVRDERERLQLAADYRDATGHDGTTMELWNFATDRRIAGREAVRIAITAEEQFDSQFTELGKEFPQAREPGVRDAIYKKLTGGNVAPGEVREAFYGLYGEKLIQQASQARQQQATRSSRQVSTPPGAGGTEQPAPTSDLDEIAERQKKSGVIQRLLGRS